MLKIGEFLFRYRDYTPLPFIVIMGVFAQANQCSLITGGVMMILGELIRINGVAYIGGVSRTRSYSTGQKVITGGPFARVRNPLYVGNFFLSTGLVVAAWTDFSFIPLTHSQNAWGFAALFAVIFFVQYFFIVNWEETNLTEVFGQDYLDYKSAVPRWIPRIFPAKIGDQEKIQGDYSMALKSEKNTAMIAITLLAVILWRSGMFNFGG